jgi:hypothetical protein
MKRIGLRLVGPHKMPMLICQNWASHYLASAADTTRGTWNLRIVPVAELGIFDSIAHGFYVIVAKHQL